MAFDVLLAGTTAVTALRERPHIIHAHLHEGALVGKLVSRILGIPLVFDFQGSLTGEMIDHGFLHNHGLGYQAWRRLEWIIDHLPDAIITSSYNAADLLVHEFRVPSTKVLTITDCVNPTIFQPRWMTGRYNSDALGQLRDRLGIPPDRTIVVYLGLLAPWQGTSVLLEAATRVIAQRPSTHFLIMGFPSVEYWREQARRLGLDDHVTFPGRIPYEEAADHLALGEIAVSPKMSATEGSGKILNYMAMGLPVVAFDTPVSREYLGELGVYAPLGDAVAFADALVALLDDPVRRHNIGQALRERAIRLYSWDVAGRQIVEVYTRLLSGEVPVREPHRRPVAPKP